MTYTMFFDNFLKAFTADLALPEIPDDVLCKYLESSMKKNIKNLLIRQQIGNRLVITPGKLFEQIDPNWKTCLLGLTHKSRGDDKTYQR